MKEMTDEEVFGSQQPAQPMQAGTELSEQEVFGQIQQPSLAAPSMPQQAIPSIQDMLGGQVTAGFEPLRSILTGAIAEPIAGLAGLASLPFVGPEGATENIQAVRDYMTYQPKTPEGQAGLQRFGETVAPIIEPIQQLESYLGEKGYGIGGPIGGAIGETLPTAALMALGTPQARGMVKPVGKAVESRAATKMAAEAAPSTEALKQSAREIYNELDNIGATINPGRVTRLGTDLRSLANKEGFNRRIHPKVSAALDEIESVAGQKLTVSNVDTLRKVARSAAKSIEPDEARLGALIVNKIDDFLDNLQPKDFAGTATQDVGSKFKNARQLWSRAKKSELIEDAFEKARNQASGFENGLRVQFRSILNNKKLNKNFSSDELDLMRKVIRGGPIENTLKVLGKFGFNEGQATNVLMGSLGVAGGAAIGGPAGAVAVPLVGQVSRNLAQKMTRNNSILANQIVKAGNNGIDIAKAYMKNVPAAERSIGELTELLMKPDISLNKLKTMKVPPGNKNAKLMADAAFFAAFIRSQQEEDQ